MRAIILMLVLASAGAAHADRPGGVAWLHYEVTELHALDEMTRSSDVILAGARLGGIWGTRVGLPVQFDFQLGSTIDAAGFAYEVSLLPAGLAVRPTVRSLIALAFGVSANGAVGTLDDAVALPMELTAQATLGPLRLLARGRALWLAGANSRQDGSRTLGWADELDATVGIRIGKRYTNFGFESGNGYFIGASYREQMGAQFVGLVIGYSLDGGTKRSGAEW